MNRLILLIFISLSPVSMNSKNIASFLPASVNGWVAKSADSYYNTENLYDYIDGAAELYLSYGFDTVVSRRYSCEGEPDIVVEIFNMLEPRNAFGVFSNMREKNQHRFGQGSQEIQGSLIFWKDHYFVSVIPERSSPKCNETLTKLAAEIDNAIPGKGELPEVMNLIPQENRVEEGYCYFHHYIWLNAFHFISNDNILNIDSTSNAVLVKYNPPESRMYLLVVQYAGKNEANAAYNKFISLYAPELKPGDALKLEDKSWFSAEILQNLVAAVFNAHSKNDALTLLKKWEETTNALKH